MAIRNSPASASMPAGQTPRFSGHRRVHHLQANVHTMRDEAVIIFGLHVVAVGVCLKPPMSETRQASSSVQEVWLVLAFDSHLK